MAKVLEMLFNTAQGKKFTISVDEPRADLTGAEVVSGMQGVLASNVFYADGANLVSADQARIVERNVTEL
ncbi:MAG: DUF2922 domain-containing protein [Planococcaceae bacterium]|uniref:DUF2922 domain-containing protein n=1 Tax=Paenisporosarcina quisquiliarum TaxID=365346 RepID=UPI002422D990|nr:DUF2922 domain-containing protein [Bacillota bacterium]MDX1771966.1 DUF2922 domain-containing protein [Planococcaceae bacterium]